ncbi:hypothetical protein PsAD13_03222 [Pseudovibrio sp. Ad13]|uniref:hypothetical protein n=1 Tax=Pseudovibrio sp. Ad13 TaxID=989396 RepID=UPI0007AE9182|nr:hypothetical protein [Pseudovibrio sp. Ad13]KZK83020.1 hypothetical protein PsAD13_03222 [Pseudovibrio sp. Ad13]
MSSIYWVRAGLTAALILSTYIIHLLPVAYVWWMFVPIIVLAIMTGRVISTMLVGSTGFSFFLTPVGLGIFYSVMLVLTPIVAPVYILWNVFKALTVK